MELGPFLNSKELIDYGIANRF